MYSSFFAYIAWSLFSFFWSANYIEQPVKERMGVVQLRLPPLERARRLLSVAFPSFPPSPFSRSRSLRSRSPRLWHVMWWKVTSLLNVSSWFDRDASTSGRINQVSLLCSAEGTRSTSTSLHHCSDSQFSLVNWLSSASRSRRNSIAYFVSNNLCTRYGKIKNH